MGRYYPEPINHGELPFKRIRASNLVGINCRVQDPTQVEGTGTVVTESGTFNCRVTFNRSPVGTLDVGGTEVTWDDLPARMTDKRRGDEAHAVEVWALAVNEVLPQAIELLDDPDYAAKVANVTQMVEWDLGRKLSYLRDQVATLRRRAAEGFLEVGASSTGSMGNCEMAAAIAQANLAAAAETWDAAFGPFVNAKRILRRLIGEGTEDGSIDFRVNTYVSR